MADSSSLYGSTTPQGTVASSNYTTLYSGGNNFVPSGDNVIISGTLTVNGCSILTDCNAFNLLPLNATTVNAFGSATAVSIGGATGVTTIQNQLSTGNYLFPLADGTNNQILTTNGAGVLGWTSVGSLGVVTSITGTANQVIASASTGAVTLSTPQDIATTSSVAFGGLNVDSGTLYVDAAYNRVGINNTAPNFELHIDQGQDSLTQFGMTNQERTFIISNNAADDLLSFYYGPTPPTAYNRLQFNLTDQWFNTGKLGVGTATPAHELDVQGTGSFSSNLIATGGFTLNGTISGSTTFSQSTTGPNINYVLPTAQGASSTVLTNDGSGNLTWALPGGGGSTFGNITIAVDTDNTISTTTGDLLLTSATNTVSVSNKLGINTTTPGQELTISDGGDGYVQIGMVNAERTWLVTNNAGDDFISYSVVPAVGPTVNRLQFDATGGDQWFPTGKLGVGLGGPTEALDVVGNGQFTGDVAVNGGDITTTATTANIFATNARTIQIGGAGTNNSVTDHITLGVSGQTYAVDVNTLLTQRGITTQASSKFLNQTTTSPILIMTTTRTSMKGMVTVTDDVTGAIHSVEFLANRKGLAGVALITIFGEVYSDAPLATFTVVNNGSNGLELYATPASTNSTDIYITRNSLGAVI